MDPPSLPTPARSSVRQSVLYFATVAFGQGLPFLLLPIVTRYLTPEAYGHYALALVVSSLVAMGTAQWVTNVGLRLYVDAYARDATRAFYLSSSLLQTGLFIATYAAALALLSVAGIHLAPLRVLLFAGLAQLVGNQYTYTTTLLRADQRALPFTVAEISAGIIRFGATAAGLAAGLRSAELLFAATGLGFLLATGYATVALWRGLIGARLLDTDGTRELLRAGPASLPFSMAGWLERLADRLVLAFYAGPAVVGVYSVGYAVGERVIGSLVQAVFMVAWPSILNGWREAGASGAAPAIATAQRMYAWITVGPALFLLVFGRVLMGWFVGASFEASAVVVPIIVASMWVGGFGAYLNRQFELNKRYARLSGVSMAGAAVNVGLNFLLIPSYGMAGAAAATLANQAFNAAVFLAMMDRTLVRIQYGALAASLGSAGLAWLVSRAAGGRVGLAAGLFVAVYAAAALAALRRLERDELRAGAAR